MSSPQYQHISDHHIAKAAAAVTLLGGGFLALSALTFVGTVIGLAAAAPLLVIFSPVLVPAAVALFLIVSGLVVSGVCGAAAAFVFYWMYCFAAGRRLRIIGADRVEYAKEKLANAAHEMKKRIAAGLGAPAGQDPPPVVAGGDHETELDRDIAVD